MSGTHSFHNPSREILMTAIRRPRTRTSALFALAFVTTLLSATASASPDPARALTSEDVKLDADFVPTPIEAVRRMLEMAQVEAGDYVVDLGSGDGRILITAATERGVQRALGIELDPWLVEYSSELAQQAGVADQVRFEQGDLFEADFFDAEVLTMYLMPELNLRLRPDILSRMAPGTRIVSYSFDMGDWVPDDSDRVLIRDIYLWIVPADVGGQWTLERSGKDPLELHFEQSFQMLDLHAVRDGLPVEALAIPLRGREITFEADGQHFKGVVDDDVIRPLSGAGWSARRVTSR
jgi:hypothetical protein